MKKSIMLVCCIISIIMSACSAKEESISEKVHKSENLVKDSCYLLDDNVYADYYEQINGYFFLSGSEQLLLSVDIFPEIWNYEEVKKVMTEEERKKLEKEAESLKTAKWFVQLRFLIHQKVTLKAL